MKFYASLLLFAVECWGVQWKAIEDLKETLEQYSFAAVNTISSIENIIDNSNNQSELFLNHTLTNNPGLLKVTELRSSSNDKCFQNFIDEENLKFSFRIQIYQLQIPLQSRIIDIRERVNNINSSLSIYQVISKSKFRSCDSVNRTCLEETDEWIETNIGSLSCAIYPNCSRHSIRKRSTCSVGEFACNDEQCITGSYFCDGNCDCEIGCVDEPPACVTNCREFRCWETFRCISLNKVCNGIDDCGDGSDESSCTEHTTPSYTHSNCSIDAGDFLCSPGKCIRLEKVCDGYNDCGDWSDEGDNCKGPKCSPECTRKGGVCLTEPKGSKCVYECPPGTYETSEGCSRNPEAPLPTLLQVLEDTPRLISRYSARLKFLKTKTIIALSKAVREVVKCKEEEFTLLSKIIDYSTVIHEKEDLTIERPLEAGPVGEVASYTSPKEEETIPVASTEQPDTDYY